MTEDLQLMRDDIVDSAYEELVAQVNAMIKTAVLEERNGLLNTEPFRRFIGVEWEMQKEINELRGALALMGTPDADAADAARYRWLFGARTNEECADEDVGAAAPLPQDICLSKFASWYADKETVDAAIDAAMKGKP